MGAGQESGRVPGLPVETQSITYSLEERTPIIFAIAVKGEPRLVDCCVPVAQLALPLSYPAILNSANPASCTVTTENNAPKRRRHVPTPLRSSTIHALYPHENLGL